MFYFDIKLRYKMSLEHKHTLASIVNAYNKREEDDLAFEICIIRGQKYFNLLDIYGDTILHTVVRESTDLDLVKGLLRHGADVNLSSKFDGLTPVSIAIRKGSKEVAYLLATPKVRATDVELEAYTGAAETYTGEAMAGAAAEVSAPGSHAARVVRNSRSDGMITAEGVVAAGEGSHAARLTDEELAKTGGLKL